MFSDLGYEVTFLARPISHRFLLQKKTRAVKISNSFDLNFYLKRKIDLILMGSTAKFEKIQKLIFNYANNEKILVIGIADAKMSSAFRFKSDKENMIPNYLLVTNEDTKKNLVNLGFPKNKIFNTGHPQYENLLSLKKNFSKEKIKKLKIKVLGKQFENYPVITFVSEPTIPDYNKSEFCGDWPKEWINMERNNLAINVFKRYAKFLFNDYYKIIRLHPKNKIEKSKNFDIHFDKVSFREDSDSILLISDIIVGITSSMLIEAAVIGIPTLSIQSRRNDYLDIPKFVRENISLINSLKDFEKKIKKKSTFPISVSSSSKILKNFFKELNYSNE
ncbi:MAG: hypothetical protein CL572_04580 [Alphaproteobacteria bacterium]|nr:hypothetical protein [Alphaproteobacteria bacterium]